MIRAIRLHAMALDDPGPIAGWNILPNAAYAVVLAPGTLACSVMLFDESLETVIATGAASVGAEQPCTLFPLSGHAIGMTDADLGWHLLVTTTGSEAQRTVRIGPVVDLPDEVHPVNADETLALARATAAIDAGTHHVQSVTVVCPPDAHVEIGSIVSVRVDGMPIIGQVESITWSATPDIAVEKAVIRRHIAITPEP
ncbi:MAG: hypothetical protein KUA37_02050 [Desulfomicrobium sp.]|nr:hypothetical protein [Pseudomonadota bacterium]MBU4570382.1 hypothetical protein [Pseudomonadota bacterium]MBU4593303.1 hypothetical protein [Pseudomonadota bacterium]MBV1710774.1 hypothetical protein [Desulfomicrobium sp.]MBV1721565.1 hypothetical protein [Desulfomicrobium sp.]